MTDSVKLSMLIAKAIKKVIVLPCHLGGPNVIKCFVGKAVLKKHIVFDKITRDSTYLYLPWLLGTPATIRIAPIYCSNLLGAKETTFTVTGSFADAHAVNFTSINQAYLNVKLECLSL